jgi:transposase-like protein
MMTKKKDSAEKAIRDIRRATRRRYSAEEKIRAVSCRRLGRIGQIRLAAALLESLGYST